MRNSKFGIKENGTVYCLGGFRPRPLGHIAYATLDGTLLADEVRVWWTEQLASEGPLETLDAGTVEDEEPIVVELPESVFVICGEVDDLVEALLAD
jgi:hypothetical protein